MPFGRGEILKVQIHDGRGNIYIITSKDINSWFIYKDDKKLGKGHNPYELENKYVKFAKTQGNEDDPEPDEYKDDISVTAFEMQQHENERRKAMGLSRNENISTNPGTDAETIAKTKTDAKDNTVGTGKHEKVQSQDSIQGIESLLNG